MSNVEKVSQLLNAMNQAAENHKYAEEKIKKWSAIAITIKNAETLCKLLLDKEYCKDFHGLVEKTSEEISENNTVEQEAIQESSVVEQQVEDNQISAEEMQEIATAKESDITLDKKAKNKKRKA